MCKLILHLQTDIIRSMKKLMYLTFVLASVLIQSCKNDVVLSGPYEDRTIVYGLLNQNDTAHYIRIQKAFLVNGNALDYTGIPDSIQYKPGDLAVKIQQFKSPSDTTTTKTILLTLTNEIEKDSGAFAYPGIQLFKTTEKLVTGNYYRLVITNLKNGKVITGSTPLVYGFIWKGNFGLGTITWNNFVGTGLTIRFDPATNGVIYEPEVVFYYREVNITTNDTIRDSLVWKLVDIESPGVGEMSYNFPQNSFYSYISTQLTPPASGVKRIIGTLTFRFYAGTQELDTYINSNKPSIGIIQEKPVYTNLTNSLGIFAARSVFERRNVVMSESAKDTLVLGTYTKNLGFTKQ